MENCTEQLSPRVDLSGLYAGLAAHDRINLLPKRRPSAMGTSDAKCAARNIRKYFAFKILGEAGGLLSNKKKAS